MNSIARRLRKLETARGAADAPLPPLVYNILDKNGMSVGNFLIAGKRFGEFRQATASEVALLFERNKRAKLDS